MIISYGFSFLAFFLSFALTIFSRLLNIDQCAARTHVSSVFDNADFWRKLEIQRYVQKISNQKHFQIYEGHNFTKQCKQCKHPPAAKYEMKIKKNYKTWQSSQITCILQSPWQNQLDSFFSKTLKIEYFVRKKKKNIWKKRSLRSERSKATITHHQLNAIRERKNLRGRFGNGKKIKNSITIKQNKQRKNSTKENKIRWKFRGGRETKHINNQQKRRNDKFEKKTNLCCELVRLGGGIGVVRFVMDPLEENGDFLLRGNGATLSCASENVLWRFSSFTIVKLL